MKIYFDDVIDINSANCFHLSSTPTQPYWLTANGTRLKKELQQLGIEYSQLTDNIEEPGLYFIDVNADPNWWTGLCQVDGGPANILESLPVNIVSLLKLKKLRLVIAGDREGGNMIVPDRGDGFLKITEEMERLELPAGSVYIIQGNRKISDQYNSWLQQTGKEKLFEVRYINHFDRIFIDLFTKLPESPSVLHALRKDSFDYNSLNRTYKDHRSVHLYYIAKHGLLDKGLVSANEIRLGHSHTLKLLKDKVTIKEVDQYLTNNYPKYIDGNWSVKNAANSVNEDIFKNSLISFVTETKFDEDVVFLTEKVFKCLTYGHPMILLGSCGTLSALRDYGYKTDWCGIDPSYNDIENHADRFDATHKILIDWIALGRKEQIRRIRDSIPTLEHNMSISRNNNFYHTELTNFIKDAGEYFNE